MLNLSFDLATGARLAGRRCTGRAGGAQKARRVDTCSIILTERRRTRSNRGNKQPNKALSSARNSLSFAKLAQAGYQEHSKITTLIRHASTGPPEAGTLRSLVYAMLPSRRKQRENVSANAYRSFTRSLVGCVIAWLTTPEEHSANCLTACSDPMQSCGSRIRCCKALVPFGAHTEAIFDACLGTRPQSHASARRSYNATFHSSFAVPAVQTRSTTHHA